MNIPWYALLGCVRPSKTLDCKLKEVSESQSEPQLLLSSRGKARERNRESDHDERIPATATATGTAATRTTHWQCRVVTIILFHQVEAASNVKLRDMDEKHMHNLFLKNMSVLIEETKNPSPCMNPWVFLCEILFVCIKMISGTAREAAWLHTPGWL